MDKVDTTILSLTSAKVDDRCGGQATLPIYYKCEACNYISVLKANYDRHMLTKKHLKNIEKFGENGGGEKFDEKFDEKFEEEIKNITTPFEDNDIFYATKIYNTLFEMKRQYPYKYQFVRNTNRMKHEWKRWSQEQFDNDYVYCYTKWFSRISKCNEQLIEKFVF